MDRIPLEIAAMIVGNLLEYDLAPGLKSQYTEQPSDKLVRFGKSKEDMVTSWMMFTECTRLAVLSARLSCRKLYAASSKAFATLLGDRTFRLTEVGTNDLRAIGQDTRLTPYVTSLTIGCTGFCSIIDAVDTLNAALASLQTRDRNRLLESYKACVKWQSDNKPHFGTILVSLLEAFPKLDTIRIDRNYDLTTHVSGWLQAGDADLLHRYFHNPNEKNDKNFRFGTPFAFSTAVVGCHTVLEAVDKANVVLRDLRISGVYMPPYTENIPFQTLRTLRIRLMAQSGVDMNDAITKLSVHLSGAQNLQDLALNGDYHPYQDSSRILNALSGHTNLQRISLTGSWVLYEQNLISFVSAHAHSLQCIIFEGSILSGCWRTVLRTISRLTHGSLRFFRAQGLRKMLKRVPRAVYETDITDADFASFSCPVEWVPRFERVDN
jgi:hypothetical protein